MTHMERPYLLLSRYIDICNAAIWRNRARFPFKQILGAAQKAETGRLIETVVRMQGRESVEDRFILSMEEGRITLRSHGSCLDCHCDRKWEVQEDYLEDVIKNPGIYIDNPARLNWDWLYSEGV